MFRIQIRITLCLPKCPRSSLDMKLVPVCLGLHHCRFKMATINQESVVKRTSSTNFVTVTSSCSSGTPSFVSSFSSSSSFRFLGGVNCLFNRGPSAKRKICCFGEFHLRELIFDVSTLIFLRSDKHTQIF